MTIHLRSIGIKPAAKKLDVFPFRLPVVRKFRELKLGSPVTFLVGENGSGKSTVLEAIAAGGGSVVVGGEGGRGGKNLAHARALASPPHLVWAEGTHPGVFLPA